MTIGKKILKLRKKLGISQAYLADKVDVSSQTLYKYEKDLVSNIPTDKLEKIADVLNTTPAYLMGWEDTPSNTELTVEDVHPIDTKEFRVLGEIACGFPTYAEEEYETYIEASSDINADFCLIARGDSMTGVRINDGDVVFIKEQSVVENGQIAAVIINNEATLKTWYFYPDEKKLILNPENPNYPPLVFIGEQLVEVRCLGRAICFTSYL
jgi:repressor LexA